MYMYFLIDSKDQTIVAARKRGEAARRALKKLEVGLPSGADPVKLANAGMGDRMAILNLSDAFLAIADSDDEAAQDMAKAMANAVDGVFNETV